jgi:hypothetical protein
MANVKATPNADELRTCHKCKEGLLEVVEGSEIGANPGHYYFWCPKCRWLRGISFPRENMRFTA